MKKPALPVSIAITILLMASTVVSGQSPIVTMTLGSDQIGQIKSAQEITTRISFPEPVKEIICGDLYDSTTGKGSFVVQRSDKDVFVKPIASKAISNLFVKTGEKGDHIYNFDLSIVPVGLAYRVVNVVSASPPGPAGQGGGDKTDDATRAAEQTAAETIRKAREQASRILDQAQQSATEIKRQAEENAAEIDKKNEEEAKNEIEQRFVTALMVGLREVRIKETRTANKKIAFTLDRSLLQFADKAYLRFIIRNNGAEPFSYAAIMLEAGSDAQPKIIPVQVLQNKQENIVGPTESLTGVVVFDPNLVDKNDVLRLVVRDKDKIEIARLVVVQTG
jgi:cell division septum initiation protein DivIVA